MMPALLMTTSMQGMEGWERMVAAALRTEVRDERSRGKKRVRVLGLV